MTTRLDDGSPDEAAFRRLYEAHFDALLTYALRRVSTPADAADVVSDTFLVAWRRRRHVPAGDEARLWLYGVARNMLANQHRSVRRRDRLGERLRERLQQNAHLFQPAQDDLGVREALAGLHPLDREVLTLSAWEQLEPREIAEVLGIAAPAARARLSRARRRLRTALGHEEQRTGHVSLVSTEPAPEEGR